MTLIEACSVEKILPSLYDIRPSSLHWISAHHSWLNIVEICWNRSKLFLTLLFHFDIIFFISNVFEVTYFTCSTYLLQHERIKLKINTTTNITFQIMQRSNMIEFYEVDSRIGSTSGYALFARSCFPNYRIVKIQTAVLVYRKFSKAKNILLEERPPTARGKSFFTSGNPSSS